MTAATILRLDAAMRGNKVIYWLGRIPLVKKLVSDTLYESSEGKLALSVILWIWRIFKSFAGTFLYVGLMCVLPLLPAVEPGSFSGGFSLFCWLLFWLSFVMGSLLNPFTMEADQLKYTAVRMMGINARTFHLVQGTAYHIDYLVTFAAALMAATALLGQGVLPGLLLTAELTCARLLGEWFHVWLCGRLKKPLHGRVWFTLTVIFGGLCAAYIPLFFLPHRDSHWLTSLPAALILLAGGIFAAVRLIRYPNYYRLTLDLCRAEKVSAEVAKQKNAEAGFNDVKLKDSDLTAESASALTGWPCLQDLFFRRHSRMMYKPMKYILIVIGALTAAGCGLLLFLRNTFETARIFSSVTVVLPYLVFILYLIQSNIMGNRITRAMFYNCDLAMLKFGWYREGPVILKNFVLRFRRICGVNLLMSAALCVMFTAMTLCAGGRPPAADFMAFLAAILCLSVFFSVHSLGMYYLFQPFTSDLKVKNPFFAAINGVMYAVCYACIQIRSTPTWFTPVVLAVTVIYSAVILLLVRKRAPKTFRVK